ncbi:MAG: class I SAM-dependent methyltransferase [Hyphomicrobiales bacterium]|nr:class I SAM-dependent methyltransferase [Hyphomicrobiales bacterium]MDE2017237.1 class I SAM-dependent methyltransferase [Hyphomicrobiales bacterium]
MTGEESASKPTWPDDRAEFEAQRRRDSLAMGEDAALFREARDVVMAADRHRYTYMWSWMGVPIIQMPADIVATQEIVWATKPDVIVETGVARGGSVVFYASMLTLLGKGKVIGVDVDIRAHNRETIESHPMAGRISLVEGSSTDPGTIARVKALVPPGASTMLILDSDHSKAHVLAELRALSPLVTPGQFLIVADTLLGRLDAGQTPTTRAKFWPPGDEPLAAVHQFLIENDGFHCDREINAKMILSSSPGGYLRSRVK